MLQSGKTSSLDKHINDQDRANETMFIPAQLNKSVNISLTAYFTIG